jgi:hypothetical protein
MMHRRFLALSASAILLAVAGCEERRTERAPEGPGERMGAQGAGAQSAGTVTGKVVSAKEGELVVKDLENDEELKLKVESSTQVLIDGRQAPIGNLREGAQVRASFDSVEGERRATRIEAMGASGAGAGDQPGGSAGTTGGLGGASSRTPGQMGGPGGESATSASEPGAPRGEPGKSEAQRSDKK